MVQSYILVPKRVLVNACFLRIMICSALLHSLKYVGLFDNLCKHLGDRM